DSLDPSRPEETVLVTLRRAAVTALVVCVVAALAGGSDGRVVVPLRLDPRSLTEPTDARLLRTTDEAVRGIPALMAKQLGLPAPARVVVHVYHGRRAFEQGLIRDARVSPVQAATLSGFAIGVGTRGQVLLNERPADRTEREWLRLIAHELTHVSQIELAGGEERGEQWLAEGMAEKSAFSTLDRRQPEHTGPARPGAAGAAPPGGDGRASLTRDAAPGSTRPRGPRHAEGLHGLAPARRRAAGLPARVSPR